MQSTSLEPRPQTFQVLSRTRNAAAVPVLISGLSSPLKQVRAQCVQLLMQREEPNARRAVVTEWTRLDLSIRESLRNAKFELTPACREVLLNGTAAERQMVITAIGDLDMTSALPELIRLGLNRNDPNSESSLNCITEMCERWASRHAPDRMCQPCVHR